MEISDEAVERLQRWVGPETWHTGHPADEARFFRFVHELWNCNHALIDEVALKGIIAQAVQENHSEWNGEQLTGYIEKERYAAKAQNIMVYHEAVAEM